MLLRFKCKNFRSIKDEQTFSMVAAATRSDERNHTLLDTPHKDIKALRCAAFYGANASGKSNFLKAMDQFSTIIALSHRAWSPTGGIPAWDPFRLDDYSRDEEASFEADFVIDNFFYNYGFRFDKSSFIEEWLIDNSGRAKTLFRRSTAGGETQVKLPGRNLVFGSNDLDILKASSAQTRDNSLFLSSASQSNHELLSRIFKFLTPAFEVHSGNTSEAYSAKEEKRKVVDLLVAADAGIMNYEVSKKEVPDIVKEFINAMHSAAKAAAADSKSVYIPQIAEQTEITMFHRGAQDKPFPLEFSNESAGTQKYFNLVQLVLKVINSGSILTLDEIESSLHPLLARHLIRIFNDPELNPKGTQLIFTTHNSDFLDLDLLRRDQLWFTEKSPQGATSLVSLADFKPRKGQNLESAYLGGRFGAIPLIDEELFLRAINANAKENIDSCLEETEVDLND